MLTPFERVLKAISPGLAARRVYNRLAVEVMAESLNAGGGFDGGGESRWRDSAHLGKSRPIDEDRHMGPRARQNMRLELRDIRRNYGLMSGHLQRLAQNVVTSLRAEWDTGDDALNREYEEWFASWQSTCDVVGERSLEDCCRIIVQQRPTEGDGLIVKLADGRIQMVESERIATPSVFKGRIIDGVEVDRIDRPLRFWVAPRNDAGVLQRDRCEPVERGEAVWWKAPHYRADALRGVPDLHAVVTDLADMRDLQRYVLNRAKLDQLNAWLITSDSGGVPKNLISRHEADGKTSADPVIQQMDGFKFWWMRNGNDVKSLASQSPNAQYVGFNEQLVRILAAGCNLPYELFILDFRGLSWSTARAIMQIGGNEILARHAWLSREVLKPLAWWRVAMAIQRRELPPAPVDSRGRSRALRVEFSVPEYQWLERIREINADSAEWHAGQTSLDRMARKRNATRDELMDERMSDMLAAIQRAQLLTAQTGVYVSHDRFLPPPTPGVQMLDADGVPPPPVKE